MIRVLLLLDISSEYDRKMLKGLVRYSREQGPWAFYRMPEDLQRGGEEEQLQIVEFARKWKADAIVGKLPSVNHDLLSKLRIPVVLKNYRVRDTRFSVITGDYIGSGRKAAQYLSTLGCDCYAFFGLKDVIWSNERRQGFVEEMESASLPVSCLEVTDVIEEREARNSVGEWLKALPKPAGIFACDDAHALYLSEICKINGIRIPSEVSLLGIDNDELLCNISDPPISSIDQDVEMGGYKVAELLDQRIKSGDHTPFSVVIRVGDIVRRASTDRYDFDDAEVKKVLQYIDANFKNQITVDDILAQVPLCRRSVEIRFKKAVGISIYQYLLKLRVDYFAHLISSSYRHIGELALEAGFKDYGSASKAFKSAYGLSPKDYRESL